ncbi:YutD family protein [Liquorilactobacillus oeni]|nr:YutD family protein [Liquorilactobacillus oeni]
MDSEKKERREAQLAKKAETLKAYASDIKMKSKTELTIDGHPYVLVKNFKDGFQTDRLEQRFSQILTKYDYIVGDWGYDQLRLHGFYAKKAERGLPSQKIDQLDDYLYEYCNFGCAYFILQNLDVAKPSKPHRRNRGGHSGRSRQNKAGGNSQNKRKGTHFSGKNFEIRKRTPEIKQHVETITEKHSKKRHFTIRQKKNIRGNGNKNGKKNG